MPCEKFSRGLEKVKETEKVAPEKEIYKYNLGCYIIDGGSAYRFGSYFSDTLPNLIKEYSHLLIFDSYPEPHSILTQYANGNILLILSHDIWWIQMNIWIWHSRNCCCSRCLTYWFYNFHLLMYVNSVCCCLWVWQKSNGNKTKHLTFLSINKMTISLNKNFWATHLITPTPTFH